MSTTLANPEHHELLSGLKSSPKSIPCSYLYDMRGSQLYDQITDLPEYYPYSTEMHMLQQMAPSIIKHIPPGSVIVELGCGSATKTSLILNALLDRDGAQSCFFEGIDCSSDFLQSAQNNLQAACPRFLASNLGTVCALYLDGLKEARRRHPDKVLCVLWLGSSVGNMDDAEALGFFEEVLTISGARTQVLVCADLWKDAATLHAAYHDGQGVTEAFIKNGLSNALSALGAADMPSGIQDWTYDVVVNADLQQVEMWLVASKTVSIPDAGISIAAGERVLMEVSRKFTQPRLRHLASQAGWYWQASWANAKYSIQMLCSPELALQACWTDTDAIFAAMPDWASHPITIRHPFCFYYGHVAAFAKLKILPQREVRSWDEMFSRGIDPDVLDPSQCHGHPDAPAEWPTKQEILDYSMQVRQQLLEAVSARDFNMHSFSMALEHERMHQETLAYMQAQQRRISFEAALQPTSKPTGVCQEGAKTVAAGHVGENGHGTANGHAGIGHAANGHTTVNGHAAAANGNYTNGTHPAAGSLHACNGALGNRQANGHAGSCEVGTCLEMRCCPAGKAVLGVNLADSAFAWDNEGPQQAAVNVPAFAAAAHPVTVGEFRRFVLEQRGYDRCTLWDPSDFKHFKKAGQRHPTTWTVKGSDVWVHTNEATKHWTEVADEPVWVSLAEAQAFCAAHSARLMSEEEYLRLLELNGSSEKQRWYKLRKGGWEWTASKFRPFHGFRPMPGYPEYSTDFFDGKHMVLKGSSPVTHPSLIRDSFRNFYQRQYPFMFAKFRCCISVND